MRDAASRVRVELGALPGLLYRISTPAGAGLKPLVSARNGVVRAALRQTGADGPDEVRIVLNRDVHWDIRLPAGAGEQQLDLAAGRVGRLELGASGLVEVALPRPVGTVGVTLLGGAGSALITAPGETGMRLVLDAGAEAVTSAWSGMGPARAGAVLDSPAWRSGGRGRYVVRARGRIGELIVRRSDVVPA